MLWADGEAPGARCEAPLQDEKKEREGGEERNKNEGEETEEQEEIKRKLINAKTITLSCQFQTANKNVNYKDFACLCVLAQYPLSH